MYAIAIIRYRKPLDEVQKHTEAHRAYLRGLHAKGTLLSSGPFAPRNGGALLLRVSEENMDAELNAIRDNDPFTIAGAAQYELLPWDPVIGREALEKI